MDRAGLWLKRLEVEHLRRISQVSLDLQEGLNWIVGGNGAGKTTILEAVFLLFRGKSFRGRRHGTLVQAGREASRVCGSVGASDLWREVDVQLGTGGMIWRENGVQRAGLRELTVRPHVRFIGENCQRLLEGEPELRRLFLDWNLFHVEQRFGAELARLRRVTAQRNAWLRSGGHGRAVWDSPYVQLAEKITAHRSQYVSDLNRILATAANPFGALLPIRLVLNRGWPADRNLHDVLAASLAADITRGFTYYGPSRADFRLQCGTGPNPIGSRGENKLAVVVLQFAAQQIWQRAGLSCIWLVDDLAAELDPALCGPIWSLLSPAQNQILATSLIPPSDSQGSFRLDQGHLVSSV